MTKQEIASELKELAEKMKTIGIAMDYFGGFNSEWSERGAELLGAGYQVDQWVEEIEEEINGEQIQKQKDAV
jgi:hypothetical protein